MFINAQPRHVSNGFETFVPNHRPALHQRLVEMTNNDFNAWSAFRPVAPIASESWDHHLNDFANENYPVQRPYSGYFQAVASQPQGVEFAKPITYQPAHQSQCNPHKRASPQAYQGPVTDMNCFEKQSPMLGSTYSQWSYGNARGSFAEFSGMQNVLKDYTYQPFVEPSMVSYSNMGSSGILQSSYEDRSILGGEMTMEKTSPDVVYTGHSASSSSVVDPRSLSRFDMSNSQSSAKSVWWPENSRTVSNRVQSLGTLPSHDGLPKYQSNQQPQQQQYNNSWISSPVSSNAWPPRALATISPKALALDVTVPLSLSGSSQGSVLHISDSSSNESSDDDHSEFSSPESYAIDEPQNRRSRQILPSSGTLSQMVPILPSNDPTSSRTTKKRPTRLTNISVSNNKKKNSPPPTSKLSEMSRSSVHKRIEPKPMDYPSNAQSSTLAKAMQYRDAKDDFLVRSKLAGMSYKDIRKKGNFTEAESTLRGRFRTLTKHKTARVRKPEWNENDIRLLKKAVRKLTMGSDPSKCKVPWKQVAEYIADNGGSYHFGNATCRKRWDELQREAS